MRCIGEATGQELLWGRGRVRGREYELRAGGEILATLGWQRGSLAIARVANGCWSFKRAGLCHPRVTVRTVGTDSEVATYHAGWTGHGVLELGQGHRFQWAAADFWRSQWAWQGDDGSTLVRFQSTRAPGGLGGQAGPGARVEVEPAAVALPELALLVALGWYLLVLLARESDEAPVIGAIAAAGS